MSSDILRNTQEHMHVWTYFDVRFDSSMSVTVRGVRCTEVRLHCDNVMNGTVERRYGTESLSIRYTCQALQSTMIRRYSSSLESGYSITGIL